MSKLENLLETLCPDGVEYKSIGDICEISRGIVMSKDYIRDNAGEYPVYSSQTENNGELGKIATYMYDGEYLTWTTDGANAGSVFYRNGKFSVTNVCGLLKLKTNEISTRFLYFVLQTATKPYVNKGMGNAKLMSNVMATIKIPVPPIEVQKEIVKILDNFTMLSEKLSAELTARKKQYEFYRDKLLTFDPIVGANIEWKPLGEVFDIKGGYTPSKSENDFWNNGTIPWFRLEDINENGHTLWDAKQHITEKAIKKSGLFKADSLIITTSATIGEYALIKAPFLCNQRFTCLTRKKEYEKKLLPEFVLQYSSVLSNYCKSHLNVGNFASVDMNLFSNFLYPLPPLDVQERIVNVLDNFDAICSDLKIGLPSEIGKRQQQYEYYRDKLLTFKEKV